MTARHAADNDVAPSNPECAAEDEFRASARPFIARLLLILGRALLVAIPMMVVICRWTTPLWIHAPQDAGLPDHWIPNLTMATLFVGGMALPCLLLPVGSAALARRSGTVLRLPTVLGWRNVDLATATVHRINLPGDGIGTEVVVVRNSPVRWLVVTSSQLWGPVSDEVTFPLRGPKRGWLVSIFSGAVIILGMVVSTALTMTFGVMFAGLG